MQTFNKHEVYEKAPWDECWRIIGRAPVGARWVDTNQGDKEKPE